MILLILILLDNDIAENPGPFSDEISIFHVNARSVRKKLDYIESVGFDSSLICITESHLDDKVLDDDIKLDGYYDKPFRKDKTVLVVVYFLVGSLTKIVKLYNCIIPLRTWSFSCNKSTFRSPVTTTCWVKLNDCSIEC
jgi:hypothetical protein